MPNNTEDWSKYEVKTAAEPQAEDWSQYEVKKKEEPFSFGTSTSLEFPSVSTQKEEVASQEPLTYMQKQLREKGLITEDATDPNKINDVLRKVPLSFVFPHADEKFLEKSRNPLDVTGKEEDKQVVKQPLSEEDNMAIGANIDTKQEPSYFWGTVKAINQGTSSFFRTLDNATKTLEDLTGIPSGGGFGKIADSVDDVANKMPDVPDTRGGRLLRNVGNLEGMFLELAITPELKVAKIGAVPKLITQMTGAGFVNSYGDSIAKEPEKINRVIEGVKGAGGGLKDAAILTALGYGSAIAGSAVGKAVGSEVAGSVASTLTNAVGFAGSDAIEQLITTGNIDKNQLEQSFDVGLALGIPEIAKTIGTRAMVNYFTASPKVEKEAAATTKDVETLREEAINTRKDAQLLDVDTRAAEEAKANVLDGIADVKVMSSEVSKDPEKFKQSIAEDETLSPEQKDAFTKKIDETVKLQEEKQTAAKLTGTKVVGDEIVEEKQKQLKNGKEIRGNEAQRQRRQERLLRVQEIDNELGDVWSNLADIVGAKISLTGEQRAKIMPVVSQLAKLYTEKYALKGMDLVDQIIEHLTSKGINVDEETTNQITQQYARESRKVADEISQQTQGMVEGEERPIRVRDNEQARANEGEQKGRKVAEGEKSRQQGVKIIESTTLPEDIKSDFKKEGIGYVPRGRKVTKAEASEIVKTKMQLEGGREQVKADILNLANGIAGDTRIHMAVNFINDAKVKLLKSTDPIEISKYRNDISEVLASTMRRSTDVATELEANKMITQLLNSDTEFVEDIYRNEINKKNESFYQAEKENIKSAQDIISEYLNSEEFKSKYKPKVGETEGKLTAKQLRERGINKVANATGKLADIIGAKKNFTQEEMGKGTDIFDALKELGDGLLDIGVASTKELLEKIKVQTRKYFKPSEIDAISKQLLTELDAENRLKQKVQRTIALDSKDEKAIVDRLYSKGIKATDKQLKQLLADNVDLLIREGSIDDASFRELFAKAMGKDYVDPKEIERLKINAQLVTDVKRIESELENLYNKLIDAELNGVPKEELNKLRKQVSDKIREYSNSRHEAEKAVKTTGEILAGKQGIAEKIGAVIKGNLITPASQVVNIIANYSMTPIRAAKNAIASWMDTAISGMGFGIDKLRESQKQKEIDFINSESARLGIPKDKVVIPRSMIKAQRLLDKLPTSEIKKIGSGLNMQRLVGEKLGYEQGIRQLWTGALPTDLQRVELRAGLHPLDALYKNYKMLSGKEKLEFKEFIKNTYEGTIGVAPEVTFRFLNLFDKPVRMGAERAKLDELAKLKGLTGAEKEKFLELPDEESAEIARKAGDEATFQQDTQLSNAFSKLDRWSLKKAKESTNIMSKVGYYTIYYAKNMVIPFVKTPINVEMEMLGYAVPEYSIARGLNALYKGDRVAFENHMATAVVGSFMMRGIGYLFGAGILTLAQGGQEDETNAEFIAQKIKTAEYRDKPAYYINIDAWQRDIHNKIYGTNLSLEWQEGDQISSYRRFGIVSAMTMAQAEAFRGKSKEEIQAMNFWQTSHTSIMPLVKSGAEQTFVAGTSSLINVFVGSEQERDNFFLGLSKAAGATVLPNALKTYVQANDNYLRETRDATLKGIKSVEHRVVTDFKSSLPFVTKTDIPTKITIWGERVNRYEDGSSPAFQLFDITKTKTYKRDFGTKIFEFYERVSQDDELKKEIPPKSILPPVLMNKVRYKEEDVTLDPKTYEDMQLFVGSRLKEKTWAALSSMNWDSASDKHKFQKLKQLYGSQNSFRSKLIDRYVRSNKQKLDSLWLTQYGAK